MLNTEYPGPPTLPHSLIVEAVAVPLVMPRAIATAITLTNIPHRHIPLPPLVEAVHTGYVRPGTSSTNIADSVSGARLSERGGLGQLGYRDGSPVQVPAATAAAGAEGGLTAGGAVLVRVADHAGAIGRTGPDLSDQECSSLRSADNAAL